MSIEIKQGSMEIVQNDDTIVVNGKVIPLPEEVRSSGTISVVDNEISIGDWKLDLEIGKFYKEKIISPKKLKTTILEDIKDFFKIIFT